MRPTPLLGALAALSLGFGLVACGDDEGGDADDLKAELSEEFQDDGAGLDEGDADCFAEVIVDEIGADELADVDFSAESPPAELEDEFAAAAQKAIADCDIDPESLGG